MNDMVSYAMHERYTHTLYDFLEKFGCGYLVADATDEQLNKLSYGISSLQEHIENTPEEMKIPNLTHICIVLMSIMGLEHGSFMKIHK